MKTALLDFDLPERLIALRPVTPRDSARLLVIHGNGRLEHRYVRDLPELLRAGDILSVNDSKVICARLAGIRPPRGLQTSSVSVEVTLHKRQGASRFWAFAQPARRLRAGDWLTFRGGVGATVVSRSGGEVLLDFSLAGALLDLALAQNGEMPLPPYIARQRPPDERDRSDYQTAYAAQPGSIAAPTAGLHFTPELLSRLEAAGIGMVRTTLHVGAGTFLPISVEETDAHRMHSEYAVIMKDAAASLNRARAAGGRIVAVGTTSLRTLESAATPDGLVHPVAGETDIFIAPGHRFRTAEILLTNFHLPRSTLFMLVSAFMGLEVMHLAYAEAIARGYRFYSYGDACLLIRAQ